MPSAFRTKKALWTTSRLRLTKISSGLPWTASLAKFLHEATAVYLIAFHDMNEVNWPTLKKMLETDPRLQLGSHAPGAESKS